MRYEHLIDDSHRKGQHREEVDDAQNADVGKRCVATCTRINIAHVAHDRQDGCIATCAHHEEDGIAGGNRHQKRIVVVRGGQQLQRGQQGVL